MNPIIYKYNDVFISIRMSARGRCFELAGKAAGNIQGCKLIHGTVETARGRIPHAWIEVDNRVIDKTVSLGPLDKKKYYEKTKARPDITYGSDEALFTALKSGHWGPWRSSERVKMLKARRIKKRKR
jgi:hypothetical protein